MMHACFIVSLPLSFSLIGHVSSTSCQTSGGGRSPNVNVWMMTGTLVVGTSNRLEGSTLELCTFLSSVENLVLKAGL